MHSRIQPIKSYTADPDNITEDITSGYNRINSQQISRSTILLDGGFEIAPPSHLDREDLEIRYIQALVSNGVEKTLSKIRKLYFDLVPEKVNVSTQRGTLLGASRLNQTPAKIDTLEYIRALFDTSTLSASQNKIVDTTIESMVSPLLVSVETVEKAKKEAYKKAKLEALAMRESEQDGPTR